MIEASVTVKVNKKKVEALARPKDHEWVAEKKEEQISALVTSSTITNCMNKFSTSNSKQKPNLNQNQYWHTLHRVTRSVPDHLYIKAKTVKGQSMQGQEEYRYFKTIFFTSICLRKRDWEVRVALIRLVLLVNVTVTHGLGISETPGWSHSRLLRQQLKCRPTWSAQVVIVDDI